MDVTKENFPNLTAKQRAARQQLEDAAEERRRQMRDKPLRRCLECKEMFKPVKSWQKFCSPSHRMKHWNDQNDLKQDLENEETIS